MLIKVVNVLPYVTDVRGDPVFSVLVSPLSSKIAMTQTADRD